MIPRVTKKNNITSHWTEYTDKEIQDIWEKDGQGRNQSKSRGPFCVVTTCSKNDAVAICQYFIRNLFAIPTCTHYNGDTVSLFCGDAGSECRTLMAATKSFIDGYLNNFKSLLTLFI